jgi:hypothetical protein
MKCVVWPEKTSSQGTSEMGYPHRAISFGWNAAPGSFLPKPFGQSCFGSWPALGASTKAFGPGRLAPALPNYPNQSLRHASALLRQPLTRKAYNASGRMPELSGKWDQVDMVSFEARTAPSISAIADSHPWRSSDTLPKTRGFPIRMRIFLGRGIDASGGIAFQAPSMMHGTTGTSVPQTIRPSPGLKRPIFPVLDRVPSGKRMKTHSSSARRCLSSPRVRPV